MSIFPLLILICIYHNPDHSAYRGQLITGRPLWWLKSHHSISLTMKKNVAPMYHKYLNTLQRIQIWQRTKSWLSLFRLNVIYLEWKDLVRNENSAKCRRCNVIIHFIFVRYYCMIISFIKKICVYCIRYH